MSIIDEAKKKLAGEIAAESNHAKQYCMAEIAAYLDTVMSEDVAADIIAPNHDLCTLADDFVKMGQEGTKDHAALLEKLRNREPERLICKYYGIPFGAAAPAATPKKTGFVALSLD